MEGPNVCSVFYQIHYSKTKALITWIYIFKKKKHMQTKTGYSGCLILHTAVNI